MSIFKIFILGVLGALTFTAVSSVDAQQILVEDFQSGLGQWVGKNGGTDHAITVADPLASGHGSVLAFTALNEAGDIFSTAPLSWNGPLALSFDYLGWPSLGAGFIGVSYSLNPGLPGLDHFWLAGVVPGYGAVDLVNDGTWHHYSISLDGTSLNPFHIMLEDFDQSGGVAGNGFFDNIALAVVPEPSVGALVTAGLGTLLLGSRSRWLLCKAKRIGTKSNRLTGNDPQISSLTPGPTLACPPRP